MSNVKISEFPYENKSGFTPSDLLLMVNYQLPSGTTVNTTLTDLQEYILNGSIITGGTYSEGVYQFFTNTGVTFNVSATTTYSAGVISGGTWSSTGTGGINLPEVKVALFNNPFNFEPIYVNTILSGTTGLSGIPSLNDNDTNYIVIDYNGGNPKWDVLLNNSSINNSNIVLYMIVYRLGNFVHVLDFGNQGAGLPNKLNDRVIMTDRFARESGFSLGLSGLTGVVTLSGGVSWNATNRQPLNPLNSQDDIFFQNFHISGSWGYSTSATTLNNQYYDNGVNPVLSSAGKFLVNWYFRGQEINDHIYEVWGSDEYDSLSEAQLSTEPNLPELITSHAFLVGRIIVEYGSSTGSVESSFVTYFQGSQVQSHNDLTSIQGGGPGEYYHLTYNEYLNLPFLNTNNIFQSGVTATTISATTYQNLPIDPDTYVTAFTYNNNVFTINQNNGQPDLTATINTVTGWTVNGNLTVTGNTSAQGLTATTISASTYQNLPFDKDSSVIITPISSTNSLSTFGTNGFLLAVNPGTGSPTINGTNYYLSLGKTTYRCSASFGSVASLYSSVTNAYAPRLDYGMMASFKFGIDSYAANMRMFVGLGGGTSAPTNVEPDTLTNHIGICKPSGATNFYIMSNDSTGTASLIDLGVNFPANTSQTDVYFLRLWGDNTSVNYLVERYSSSNGSVIYRASGIINSDIPINSTILLPRLYVTNNTSSSQVAFMVNRITMSYLQ